jgi:hypothetical protein
MIMLMQIYGTVDVVFIDVKSNGRLWTWSVEMS